LSDGTKWHLTESTCNVCRFVFAVVPCQASSFAVAVAAAIAVLVISQAASSKVLSISLFLYFGMLCVSFSQLI